MRAGPALLGLALLAGSAGVGYYLYQNRAPSRLPAVVSGRPRSSGLPPGSVFDPLVPERPALVDAERDAARSGWTAARPAFQFSRPASDRGGVEPCNTQPVDGSQYSDWSAPFVRGKIMTPLGDYADESGGFDLVIHLHGNEIVRRELIESRQRFVLYALTLGENTSYAPMFNGRGLDQLLAEIEQAVSQRLGRPAHARHVVMTAWSAGFVGVGAALGRSHPRLNAAILIDGLHAPRNDRPAFEAQMKPFVDYAARAAAGDGFFVVTHSSIDPPGFASTTECAHYLVASLGGKPQAVKRRDALGLELVEYFSRGNFNVRGYAGNGKADHCAQLGALREAFAALGRYWARAKP
jgi:hypothetical protein